MTYDVAFCVWGASSLIHVAACIVPCCGFVACPCTHRPTLAFCSSCGWHLGGFHFLRMGNHAAGNIQVHMFVWMCFPFLLSLCLGLKLPGHVISMFNISTIRPTIFQRGHPTLPAAKGSSFPPILASTCYCLSFFYPVLLLGLTGGHMLWFLFA